MGNAFMPSVAASLNQASGQGLLEILQQRILQQEMEKQMLSTQRQGMNDSFSMAMRLKDQQQQDVDRKFRTDADADRRLRDDRNHQRLLDLDKQKADTAALEAGAKSRQATNVAGARSMFMEGLQRGASRRDLIAPALEGNVSSAFLPKDEAAPKAPKATKVAKDSGRLPNGVKSAIQAKKGKPGWTNAREAMVSIGKNWDAFLGDHPDLDRDAVRSYIGNLYNERLTPTMVAGGAPTPQAAPASDRSALKDRIRAKAGLKP
jgi:hypothetical protein